MNDINKNELNDQTVNDEDCYSKSNRNNDGICSRANINWFGEKIFRENRLQFSRYNIERKWQDIIKSNNDVKRMNKKKTEKQLTYWDYQARRMNRAVTEPNIQTIRILGTDILQKSNSFHELHNFKQQPNPPAESFKPKLVTWLYVTKAQCYYINFTRTDTDLIKVFDEMFEWKEPNEKIIMSRLFADKAKYCKKHELDDEKMSAILGIYYYTHLYNISLDTLSYEGVYGFFKELIIRHSVLKPPNHTLLFTREEAKHFLTYFLNKYLTCLPLIRHICVSNSKMQNNNESNQDL